MKHINLISYFGGKFPHLPWLIDLFPKGNYHFVDLMCGSANVALNVDYPLISINDLNGDVVNLFEVLRNNYDDFFRAVYFTPFSREELNNIITDALDDKDFEPIEKARRYYAKCQLGYGANGSQNNHYGAGFEWKLYRSNFYRVDNWNSRLNKLPIIVDKLRHMQITKLDALELFDKVNIKGNIVYIDPPYLLSLRKSKKRYNHEQEDDFHLKLAEKVKNANCYVAISGYDSELYSELFSGMHVSCSKVTKSNVGKISTREMLWTNYDPAIVNGSLKLQL